MLWTKWVVDARRTLEELLEKLVELFTLFVWDMLLMFFTCFDIILILSSCMGLC